MHGLGERYELRNHAAQDVTRYDVVKDLARIERIVAAAGAHDGMVLIVTNDAGYRRESLRQTVDQAFRLHEGRLLAGELWWSPATGAGTVRGRESTHHLAGAYPLSWRDFSTVVGQPFRRLAVYVC